MAIFYSDLEAPRESVKVFICEERKRGVQKQLGEVTLDMSGLKRNATVQNWYPIIGDKGATIGELRIRSTYVVDVILPSTDYNELLGILLHQDLSVVRLLFANTKEKSITAKHLVNIFQARDQAEYFLKNLIKDEVDASPSIEVLFRGNSVCTKALDHFMKLAGSLYQRDVLAPIIEVVNRETESLEVQKEKLTSEDYKRNVARLQKLTDLLLKRIFGSANHCPQPMRQIFQYVRMVAGSKFKDCPTVSYTAVTSFIFLRFFVPAVLNPKLFGLTAHMPSDMHMRIFTLIAGVLQKLANLTQYREQELYINQLNDFLADNFSKTKAFVDELVNVPNVPLGGRSVQRKGSMANAIQVDVHLAGVVRECEANRAKLALHTTSVPLVSRLFATLDDISMKLNNTKELVDQEEAGIRTPQGIRRGRAKSTAGDGLDSLLSQVIQTNINPADSNKVSTVIRLQSPRTTETELPEGATKARSGSILRGLKRLLPARKSMALPKFPMGVPDSSATEPSPRGSPRVSSPKISSPRVSSPKISPVPDLSLSPTVQLSGAWDATLSSPDAKSPLRTSEKSPRLRPTNAPPAITLSSSAPNGSSPIQRYKPGSSPSRNNGFGLNSIGEERTSPRDKSLPPLFNNDSGVSTGYRRDIGSPNLNNGVPLKSNQSDIQRRLQDLCTEEVATNNDPSDIEAMEALTDYHGLTCRAMRSPKGSAHHSPHGRSPIPSPARSPTTPRNVLRAPISPRSIASSPRSTSGTRERAFTSDHVFPEYVQHEDMGDEEEDEEDDEDDEDDEDEDTIEEVFLVKMDFDTTAIEREFDDLERLISNIKALPPSQSAPLRDISDIIPEIYQLERVAGELEEAVVLTTPKVHAGKEGLTCKFCLGGIDHGSKFLVVMGQNFHEGHLNCNICARDLSDIAFQWYKDKSYCFDCYKKGHGIRPNCGGCNQPIMTNTYTQAIGQYWHPEHFVCNVCGVGFPDGTFYNVDGKPYCALHQHKNHQLPCCGGCKQPIIDPNYIEALGEKWHTKHFNCDICGIQLAGLFVTYTKDHGQTGKGCESHFT